MGPIEPLLPQPLPEGLPREQRKLSERMNSKSALDRLPENRTLSDPIGRRSQSAADTVQLRYTAEGAGAPADPVPRVEVGEKLVFELCHVDIRRAFCLAGFAFQAEIQRLEHPLACEIMTGEAA